MNPTFRTVYSNQDGQSVALEAAEVLAANGQRYRHHRLVVADGHAGAVVLALRGDHMMFVRSERLALGRSLWELPRGVGEPHDADPAATAIRELREETGWQVHRARTLGEYVTDSSIFPQRVAVVVCEVDAEAPRSATDDEVDAERWEPLTRLAEMIRTGMIEDAHSLAALAMWRAKEEKS